jgi:hypothetical protein
VQGGQLLGAGVGSIMFAQHSQSASLSTPAQPASCFGLPRLQIQGSGGRAMGIVTAVCLLAAALLSLNTLMHLAASNLYMTLPSSLYIDPLCNYQATTISG